MRTLFLLLALGVSSLAVAHGSDCERDLTLDPYVRIFQGALERNLIGLSEMDQLLASNQPSNPLARIPKKPESLGLHLGMEKILQEIDSGRWSRIRDQLGAIRSEQAGQVEMKQKSNKTTEPIFSPHLVAQFEAKGARVGSAFRVTGKSKPILVVGINGINFSEDTRIEGFRVLKVPFADPLSRIAFQDDESAIQTPSSQVLIEVNSGAPVFHLPKGERAGKIGGRTFGFSVQRRFIFYRRLVARSLDGNSGSVVLDLGRGAFEVHRTFVVPKFVYVALRNSRGENWMVRFDGQKFEDLGRWTSREDLTNEDFRIDSNDRLIHFLGASVRVYDPVSGANDIHIPGLFSGLHVGPKNELLSARASFSGFEFVQVYPPQSPHRVISFSNPGGKPHYFVGFFSWNSEDFAVLTAKSGDNLVFYSLSAEKTVFTLPIESAFMQVHAELIRSSSGLVDILIETDNDKFSLYSVTRAVSP